MNKGAPSILALLGLLAFAGYQNRDKIADMLKDMGVGDPGGLGSPGAGKSPMGETKPMGETHSGFPGPGSSTGFPGPGSTTATGRGTTGNGSSDMPGSIGDVLAGGLGELMDRFGKAGQRDTADSWVKTGPNQSLSTDEVSAAIGETNLRELAARLGIDREELVKRLADKIPSAVDRFTPEGRLPSASEARSVFAQFVH